MKRLLVLSLFVLVVFNLRSQCGIFDVSLKTQEELEEFAVKYKNCKHLRGDLSVDGRSITDLSPLSFIESIDNLNLYYFESFNDISALSNITSISGNLGIYGFEGSVISGQFAKLTEVGYLYIGGLNRTSQLTIKDVLFPELKRVREQFTIPPTGKIIFEGQGESPKPSIFPELSSIGIFMITGLISCHYITENRELEISFPLPKGLIINSSIHLAGNGSWLASLDEFLGEITFRGRELRATFNKSLIDCELTSIVCQFFRGNPDKKLYFRDNGSQSCNSKEDLKKFCEENDTRDTSFGHYQPLSTKEDSKDKSDNIIALINARRIQARQAREPFSLDERILSIAFHQERVWLATATKLYQYNTRTQEVINYSYISSSLLSLGLEMKVFPQGEGKYKLVLLTYPKKYLLVDENEISEFPAPSSEFEEDLQLSYKGFNMVTGSKVKSEANEVFFIGLNKVYKKSAGKFSVVLDPVTENWSCTQVTKIKGIGHSVFLAGCSIQQYEDNTWKSVVPDLQNQVGLIENFFQDRNGDFWIYTKDKKLLLYDIREKTFTLLDHLKAASLVDIQFDENNTAWFISKDQIQKLESFKYLRSLHSDNFIELLYQQKKQSDYVVIKDDVFPKAIKEHILSADNSLLAVLETDNYITLWDNYSKKRVKEINPINDQSSLPMAVVGSNTSLKSDDFSWFSDSSSKLMRSEISALTFSPDQSILQAKIDQNYALFDVVSGQRISTLSQPLYEASKLSNTSNLVDGYSINENSASNNTSKKLVETVSATDKSINISMREGIEYELNITCLWKYNCEFVELKGMDTEGTEIQHRDREEVKAPLFISEKPYTKKKESWVEETFYYFMGENTSRKYAEANVVISPDQKYAIAHSFWNPGRFGLFKINTAGRSNLKGFGAMLNGQPSELSRVEQEQLGELYNKYLTALSDVAHKGKDVKRFFDSLSGLNEKFPLGTARNKTIKHYGFTIDSRFVIEYEGNTVALWDIERQQLYCHLFFQPVIGAYAVIFGDGFYTISRTFEMLDNFSLVHGTNAYSLKQFDTYYNRPDIVFERLRNLFPDAIKLDKAFGDQLELLKKAREARLLEGDEEVAEKDRSSPILLVEEFDKIPKSRQLRLKVSTMGSAPISALNVSVNGIKLAEEQLVDLKVKKLQNGGNYYQCLIDLGVGQNQVDIWCEDKNGDRSLVKEMKVNVKTERQANLYFLGIGVADYENAVELANIGNVRNDVHDIATAFKQEPKRFKNVYIDTLLNSNVNLKKIHSLKQKYMRADVDDVFVLYWGGHGNYKLDQFLLALTKTKVAEKTRKWQNTLLYTDLQSFIEFLPMRNRLLLINTCHSGQYYEDFHIYEKLQEYFLNLEAEDGSTTIAAAAYRNELQNGDVGIALSSSSERNTYFGKAILMALQKKFTDKNTNDNRLRASSYPVTDFYQSLRYVIEQKLVIHPEDREDFEWKIPLPQMKVHNHLSNFSIW